jgi:D-glycerate 3-kinase
MLMTRSDSKKFHDWLRSNSALPADSIGRYAQSLITLYDSLADAIPACLSISGAPGTGKSTLAASLCFLLRESGIAADWLSLDDYYQSKQERFTVAGTLHPLFAYRGVPGTHSVGLLKSHVTSLLNEPADQKIPVPSFDKATDDRCASKLRHCGLQCLVVEGWCLGAAAQDTDKLAEPVNELEASQDESCTWRAEVNRQLQNEYRSLNELFDRSWYLRCPNWQQVIEWRWQQARAEAHGFASREEVEQFLQPFQRLVLHMQQSTNQFDRIIPLDNRHNLQV